MCYFVDRFKSIFALRLHLEKQWMSRFCTMISGVLYKFIDSPVLTMSHLV